jgi:Zn-finger nucleic acid-binding protein
MSSCPKCRSLPLNAVQSAAGLKGLTRTPLRCPRCRGFWISLSSVSALSESGALEALEEEAPPDEQADKRSGLCPDGHGILSRVKASWRRPFYVERCRACDGIWLDAGEWRRLGKEQLLSHLDELWAPAWRHKLQAEQSVEAVRELLHERLGPELSARISDLAHELAQHPQGDLAMAHMLEIFRAERPRHR